MESKGGCELAGPGSQKGLMHLDEGFRPDPQDGDPLLILEEVDPLRGLEWG